MCVCVCVCVCVCAWRAIRTSDLHPEMIFISTVQTPNLLWLTP